MQDYELASMNAARNMWNNLDIRGCRFHYSQAVFKNMLKRGLSRAFKTNMEFKKWMKKVLSIPLLPANEIMPIFETLLGQNINFQEVGDTANFVKFKTYLRRQWLEKIGPNTLSVFSLDTATNNAAESFHAELKRIIKVHHPNIWVFLIRMNEILTDKYNQFMRTLRHGEENVTRGRRPELRRKLENIRDHEEALRAGHITPMHFLHLVSGTATDIIAPIQRAFRDNPDILENDPDIVEDEVEPPQPVEVPEVPQQVPPPQQVRCIICFDDMLPNDQNWGFLHITPRPGGGNDYATHAGYCMNCANQYQPNQECPYCRQNIVAVMPIIGNN